MNLLTDQIRIFPIGADRTDPEARALSEQNITYLVNMLNRSESNSFVLSSSYDFINGKPFDFCINGYAIRLNTSVTQGDGSESSVDIFDALVMSSSEDTGLIYASIGLISNKYLSGQDVDNRFTGVDFTINTPADTQHTLYSLPILDFTKNDDGTISYVVHEPSKYRPLFHIDEVDGGDLDI